MSTAPDLLHFEEVDKGVVTVVEPEDENGPSLAEDLRVLADQAKIYAQAEFAFQKSRAAYAAAESTTIALLYAAGGLLGFFATMAFVVGSVIALAPLLGAWGATAAVTLVLVAAVALCIVSARARTRRMLAVVQENEENVGEDGGDGA